MKTVLNTTKKNVLTSLAYSLLITLGLTAAPAGNRRFIKNVG